MSDPARRGAKPLGENKKSEIVHIPMKPQDKDRLIAAAQRRDMTAAELGRRFIFKGLDESEPAKA